MCNFKMEFWVYCLFWVFLAGKVSCHSNTVLIFCISVQAFNSGVCLSVPQCDAISTLEKEHDYRDEHLDFIQFHIRRFCLQCILP